MIALLKTAAPWSPNLFSVKEEKNEKFDNVFFGPLSRHLGKQPKKIFFRNISSIRGEGVT